MRKEDYEEALKSLEKAMEKGESWQLQFKNGNDYHSANHGKLEDIAVMSMRLVAETMIQTKLIQEKAGLQYDEDSFFKMFTESVKVMLRDSERGVVS